MRNLLVVLFLINICIASSKPMMNFHEEEPCYKPEFDKGIKGVIKSPLPQYNVHDMVTVEETK